MNIPADAIILQSNDFTVNESIITGESLPADKNNTEKNNILYPVNDNFEKDRIINAFQYVDPTKDKDDTFPLRLDTKDFSNILIDIYIFLKETNNKSFKFIHI